ncbi:hypothetical protein [Ensifer aridi]|uniref:hypothetical protein n=1 Tax=Ensifer aridi TaxID=1708715 RepID=UPI00042702FD|nr:hypothetical protein [Ensifer aridi]
MTEQTPDQTEATLSDASSFTVWIGPQRTTSAQLPAAMRAEMAAERGNEEFRAYVAEVSVMPEDVPKGRFHFAIYGGVGKTCCMYTDRTVISDLHLHFVDLAIGPLWLATDSADEAALRFYEILKDVGRLP